MKNFLGHDARWLWTMRKLNTPIAVSSYPVGTEMGKESFGYPVALSSTWYDFGDIYFDEEEIAVIEDFIRYKFRNDPAYPANVAQEVLRLAEEIKKRKIGADEVEGKTLDELLALFKRERGLFLRMIGFMSYRGAVQMGDVLAEEVRSIVSFRLGERGEINRRDDCIEQLSAALFPSVVIEEKIFLDQHAIGFEALSATEQDVRVREYSHAFEWLSYHWLVGHPPTHDEIKERMLAAAQDAQKELDLIAVNKAEQEKHIEGCIAELGLNEKEKETVRQYRMWIFLRTFVKDHINLAGYRLLPILHAIADQVGIKREHMPFLTFDEIDRIVEFSTQELRDKIASRIDGFSAGVVDGRYATEGFVKPPATEPRQEGEFAATKGSPAYQGIVRGIARVILFPKDQDRLAEGEILITSMTTPDLLPAMRRASAFVTDEGGITCHAAIVAREMKKPCVIGTRDATKIFKNGDMVEVDAERGMVSVIGAESA